MARRIIYIVLGALVIFGLLFLVWSWFFGGSAAQNQNGTFGTASSTQNTGSGSSDQNTNGQAPLGSNSTNGTVPLNGSGSGSSGTSAIGTGSAKGTVTFSNATPGVSWLNGGKLGSGLGAGSNFNPTDINSLNSGGSGSAPNITTGFSGGSGQKGLSLIDALAGASLAGVFSCGILLTSASPAAALTTAGPGVATAGFGAATTGAVPSGVTFTSVAGSALAVPTSDLIAHNQTAGLGILSYQTYLTQTASLAQQSAKQGQGFLGCLANTIAKAALQQITVSTVNWINSGFKGSPSFVTNYQQFFTNVADLAAGQFIQGSGLAFLCSPFAPQIKIALAQSYANRNAQSCTLTKVISNVTNFMNGNFAAGGWGGLVSFTTVPTNNPYGAYAYAQIGLATAQSTALQNAQNNISPTGFLNLQTVSCPNAPVTVSAANSGVAINSAQATQAARSNASCPSNCKCSVTTPGGAIATSLDNTLNGPIQQLGLAQDIDQIISALTTQLLTRTLQNGLGSLSQPSGAFQTPEDIAAQGQAQSLLTDMESKVSLAEQLGTIYQGSISDIENTQSGLHTLADCWSAVASTTSSGSATQNASNAKAQIQSFEAQITALNDNITGINNEITQLEQFITAISGASSAAEVQAIANSYSSAGPFTTQTDVTTTGQNRTTLQAQLSATNTSTQNSLNQCEAS